MLTVDTLNLLNILVARWLSRPGYALLIIERWCVRLCCHVQKDLLKLLREIYALNLGR